MYHQLVLIGCVFDSSRVMDAPTVDASSTDAPACLLVVDAPTLYTTMVEDAAHPEFIDPRTCAHCREVGERYEYYTDPNGDYICESCQSDLVGYCENCDTDVWSDDMQSVRRSDNASHPRRSHERCVCNDCAWTCDSCNQSFYGDSYTSEAAPGNSYCESCYQDSFTVCEACDCECYSNDTQYDSDSERTLCDDCYREVRREEERSSVIKSYHYKPTPQFHDWRNHARTTDARPDPRKLYFGLEVESEFPESSRSRDNAPAICSVTDGGVWYAKSDSSLSNGCEFVSHPGTLEFWRGEGFRWGDVLASKGWRSWNDTCGIHIHVSRSALTPTQWYKVGWLFRTSPDLVRRAARRTSTYARLDRHESRQGIIRKAMGYSGGDRYSAINWCNERTVEFRIFKGTLRASSIARNLEFVNAVCQFARVAPLCGMNEGAFIEWLRTDAYRIIGRKPAKLLAEWLGKSETKPLEDSANVSIDRAA